MWICCLNEKKIVKRIKLFNMNLHDTLKSKHNTEISAVEWLLSEHLVNLLTDGLQPYFQSQI